MTEYTSWAGNRRAAILATVILTVVFAQSGGRTASACDSSSCVLVTRGLSTLRKGAFAADFSFRYADESVRMSGSDSAELVILPRIDFDSGELLPAFHQESKGSVSTLQADLAYGLTTRLSAVASLPVLTRKAVEHVHLPPPPPESGAPAGDDPHGHGPAGPGGPGDPVLRDYRARGIGDAFVGLRYVVFSDGVQQVNAGLAAKVATGESQLPNSNDGGIFDPTLQPGSGSVDFVFSGVYARGRGPLQWSAAGSHQLTTANDLGYRFGNETILGLAVTRTLRAVYSRSMVAASVQVKGHLREPSSYAGQTVPSTGGRMLILSPGLSLMTPGGNRFYAFLQLPVYRYVEGTQLATRSSLLAGVSRTF